MSKSWHDLHQSHVRGYVQALLMVMSQVMSTVMSKFCQSHINHRLISSSFGSFIYYLTLIKFPSIDVWSISFPASAFFTVYLIDGVTGNLVFHCTHKRSKGPIHLIHSENWVVVSLELTLRYEGLATSFYQALHMRTGGHSSPSPSHLITDSVWLVYSSYQVG